VRLDRDDAGLQLRIDDDGECAAHDVIQHARERGGLRAMRERAERCGGGLVIEPRMPSGTRVEARLLLKEASA